MLRGIGCRLFLGALASTILVSGCEVPSQPTALPTRAFVAPPTATLPADRVYVVARGRIQDVIKARGRVASAQEVTLAFKGRGFVKTMSMREGEPVEQGALLAEMDTEGTELETLRDEIVNNDFEFQLKSVELQIAKTEPIEMDVLNAKAAVKQADVKVQQAQAAYDRVAWQGDASAAGPEAFALRDAQLTLESAQSAYNAAVARKDPQGLKVKYLETEAAYAKSRMDRARAHLARLEQDAIIKAPFSGVIVAVQKSAGDPVEPYAPIAKLADPSQVRVEATILDTDMPRLKFGQPVSITLDASPTQQFAGKVAGLSSQPTTWQGRTAFAATILFDDPTLVPAAVQMGADISILARQVDQALLVPTEAIRTEGERRYVELVSSPAARVEIGVGLTDGPLTEVLWGLSEGDRLRLR